MSPIASFEAVVDLVNETPSVRAKEVRYDDAPPVIKMRPVFIPRRLADGEPHNGLNSADFRLQNHFIFLLTSVPL